MSYGTKSKLIRLTSHSYRRFTPGEIKRQGQYSALEKGNFEIGAVGLVLNVKSISGDGVFVFFKKYNATSFWFEEDLKFQSTRFTFNSGKIWRSLR